MCFIFDSSRFIKVGDRFNFNLIDLELGMEKGGQGRAPSPYQF